jgi:predicted dehydrogenase
MTQTVRIGLIGAGANTKSRHIPGFLAIPGVELTAVCNRRPESSAAVAREFGIARTHDKWEALIADPNVDAIAVGTWPYLHCPIVIAALDAGKHVLTEARMAMNATEARSMLAALKRNAKLVGQIVPSPFGLRGDTLIKKLLADGYIGELREATVFGMNDLLGDANVPLHWRQDATLSGYNMLQLGIVHETLMRWTPPTVRVVAQVHAFVPARLDPESGIHRTVGTPDSVQVLSTMSNNACGVYQFSGVTPAGGGMAITLRGSTGMIHYDLQADKIFGLTAQEVKSSKKAPAELEVPAEMAGGWRVEADFIDSIRSGTPVRFTDFVTGVNYMEFTEAVARSAREGVAVNVPRVDA